MRRRAQGQQRQGMWCRGESDRAGSERIGHDWRRAREQRSSGPRSLLLSCQQPGLLQRTSDHNGRPAPTSNPRVQLARPGVEYAACG